MPSIIAGEIRSKLKITTRKVDIPAGELIACFKVTATDDDDMNVYIVKSDTYYTLDIKTVNPYDTVAGNATVVVIITDNNGM